jgi:SAM-dependent methyltransferase
MDYFKELFYRESKFGGFSDIDGTIAFYTRINALISSPDVVLDIGCGRGEFLEDEVVYRRNLRDLRGKVKKVVGIDVDPVSSENQSIDEYYQIVDGTEWPIKDNSIDLAFSDQVLEHIQDPEFFFNECKRVIKKEGYLCIRTTNSWGYIALGASILPNRLHSKILKRIQNDRSEEDVFPTVFRCNSIHRIKHQLSRIDFDSCVYGYDAEPAYFSFSNIVYGIIKYIHRICPNYFKTIIFSFARKVDE